MRSLLFAVAAFLAAVCESVSAAPRIAIIIDDLGYELDAGQRAIALPGPVACAILPGAPRAILLANHANASGKEVMLHLPMQAANHAGRTEPQNMTIDMSRDSFATAFDSAFEAVPFVVGINNHRGSLLTRHPGHMRWLMDEIRARDSMFFVDSYTTHLSVAMQIADEAGVPALRRDVFLDPDASPETLQREFERLKRIARRRGSAVGIGHPRDTTLAFLERMLPELEREGFELVPVSQLAGPDLRTSSEKTTLTSHGRQEQTD